MSRWGVVEDREHTSSFGGPPWHRTTNRHAQLLTLASVIELLYNDSVMNQSDQLSIVFGALADPTRRAILTRLTQGDATVAELAAPFTMSQPAVSRHLKVLEGAGLISRRRRRTARLSHLE